jgi:hypothetical protein
LPLNFATPELIEVVSHTQVGQKGASGLSIYGNFFVNESQQLCLGLKVTNMTGQVLAQDFDLRFNKNAFAVFVAGATNALTLPRPGESAFATIICTIDKKNLDGKNPPKNPFMVQVAIKTSLDVFTCQIPCMLHCLFSFDKNMNEAEY